MKAFYKKLQLILLTSSFCLLFQFSAFANAGITLLNTSGGAGGSPFVDMAARGGTIASITVRSGKFIDSIQLTYRYGKMLVVGLPHGGKGGKSSTFRLRPGEIITELGGQSGKFVDSLYIKTSKNRFKKWGGNGGSRAYRFIGSKQSPITGVWGRSGRFLDSIGAVKSNKKKKITLTQMAVGQKMTLTPSGGGATKRSVNSKGHIVITYPDGSRTEKFSGGMEKFGPDGKSMGKMLFSTGAPVAIPPDPPNNFEKAWLKDQSEGLLSIIRNLVGGDEASIDHYLKTEKASLNIYEQINKRRRVIDKMVLP